MDLDQQWLRAERPLPFDVMGLRLNPLCIDHLITLERLEVMPIDSVEALITAAQVCSRYSEQYFQDLESGRLQKEVLEIKKQIQEKGFDVLSKFKLMDKYFRDHSETRIETMLSESTDESTRGAPWLLHLKLFLMRMLGYSEREAVRMPYTKAIFEYYGTLELEGRLEIVGDTQIAMQQHADSIPEELLERHRCGS